MSYIAADGYDDTDDVCLAHSTLMSKINGHHTDDLPLSIFPPVYELFVPTSEQPIMPSLTLHNRALTIAATKVSRFSIAVYGFSSGHFLMSILGNSLPFDILIAADPDASGRALFKDVGHVPIVLESCHDLLSLISSRKTNYVLDRYIIHFPRTIKHDSHLTFWRLQANVIKATT